LRLKLADWDPLFGERHSSDWTTPGRWVVHRKWLEREFVGSTSARIPKPEPYIALSLVTFIQ